MTTLRNDSGSSLPPRDSRDVTTVSRGSGWVLAAGTLLGVVGAYNLIHGFTLLDDSDGLLNSYLYDTLTFWGWAFVIWGLLQLGAGVSAAVTRQSGVMLGVMLCAISMVFWFFMLFAAPTTALVAILLNIVVIFGLAKAEPDQY